jgi:hypothetical protein
LAGTWYHPDQNEFLRWFDSDCDIHPSFTQGKEKLDVRLVIKSDTDHGAFTDYRYTIFTFEENAMK